MGHFGLRPLWKTPRGGYLAGDAITGGRGWASIRASQRDLRDAHVMETAPYGAPDGSGVIPVFRPARVSVCLSNFISSPW